MLEYLKLFQPLEDLKLKISFWRCFLLTHPVTLKFKSEIIASDPFAEIALNGGALLRKIRWEKGKKYDSLVQKYVSYLKQIIGSSA